MTVTLHASAPPRHDRAVVFAADGAYARYACLAAAQIARLHPDRDFDICLCAMTEALDLPPSLAGLGIRVCEVATGTTFDGLRLDEGRSQVVYLRLALPTAFAAEYGRLLYLDSDIVVQRGNFSALLQVDLGGRILGAVRDNLQWRTPKRRVIQFRRLGLARAPYFNAGVLLIDVERFNAHDLLGRTVAYGREHRDRMIRHDQNLLNATLHGDWAELSPVWNWQYTRASMLFETMADPNIVHFIGKVKPWSPRTGSLPLRFRHAYSAFIAEHFPGAPQIEAGGRTPFDDRHRLRGVLWRHLLSHRRFADYLARFPDALTVHAPAA